MKERVVLDSSAFFAMEDMSGDWDAYTSPGVLRELQRYNDGRAAYLEHKVKVSDPTSNSLEKVAKAAKETGDAVPALHRRPGGARPGHRSGGGTPHR